MGMYLSPSLENTTCQALSWLLGKNISLKVPRKGNVRIAMDRNHRTVVQENNALLGPKPPCSMMAGSPKELQETNDNTTTSRWP